MDKRREPTKLTEEEIERLFREAYQEYLDCCQREGIEPLHYSVWWYALHMDNRLPDDKRKC